MKNTYDKCVYDLVCLLNDFAVIYKQGINYSLWLTAGNRCQRANEGIYRQSSMCQIEHVRVSRETRRFTSQRGSSHPFIEQRCLVCRRKRLNSVYSCEWRLYKNSLTRHRPWQVMARIRDREP